ncbi:hypothetical protein TEA_001121 [Camellia sinensis var. sinensis]|uniref:DNA topoisomerase (ATP-hydrolyzing) n=1 Tax=Camellia sinensis var. sinensis TaxID=542762 RepID=A0A4S4DAX7_CAMSN|nr:hypothetical protein TEA_001121 [Camellia sinensis var. sinensis]
MEGKQSNTKPSDLLKKIRGNFIDPKPLQAVFGSWIWKWNEKSLDLPIGKEVLALQRECHARRLDVLLRVLLIVQQLLQENRHGSKRDIYYMHPSVFQVNKNIGFTTFLLLEISIDIDVKNVSLTHEVSAGKGLVMGWLRFLEAGRKFDCINNLNTAHPVPVHVEEVKVFQRLANDQFCKRNRCIIITGRGYPDVPTRRFLRLLIEKLSLPAYCLVDCDPYGFDILTTYRFGSMQMAYDAQFLRVPEIRWLGVFPSDSEKYDLPQQCLLPLTAEGVYSVTIDAEEGLAKISGRSGSKHTSLALGRSGRHAELKWVKLKNAKPIAEAPEIEETYMSSQIHSNASDVKVGYFMTLKEAEHAAAKVALMSLSLDGFQEASL